jgi:DNA-directed RNA polymerase subunit beta
MTAQEELLESFMFDDEEGTVPDNSDLLSDDYAGEDDGYDYE